MWLDHLKTVDMNRKRGVAKAAATRRRNKRVSKQVFITTVGYVACCLEVQMSRNIGLGVKIVIHGSMATVLASHQKMSPINFIVLFVKQQCEWFGPIMYVNIMIQF